MENIIKPRLSSYQLEELIFYGYSFELRDGVFKQTGVTNPILQHLDFNCCGFTGYILNGIPEHLKIVENQIVERIKTNYSKGIFVETLFITNNFEFLEKLFLKDLKNADYEIIFENENEKHILIKIKRGK